MRQYRNCLADTRVLHTRQWVQTSDSAFPIPLLTNHSEPLIAPLLRLQICQWWRWLIRNSFTIFMLAKDFPYISPKMRVFVCIYIMNIMYSILEYIRDNSWIYIIFIQSEGKQLFKVSFFFADVWVVLAGIDWYWRPEINTLSIDFARQSKQNA